MPYITVTDPETGEEKVEWRDKASLSAEETGEGFTALDANKDDNILTGTAKAIPRMFINAGINAVQEGSDTIRDIGGAVGVGEGTTRAEPDKAILGLGDWKPEQLESSGVVEDIATGILQFGLEWVLLSKALKGVSYGLRGSKAIANLGTKAKKVEAGAIALAGKSPIAPKAAQSATKFGTKVLTETSPKAAAIDFAGFDQYEGRLYDLVTEADKWDVVEKIPLLNTLETDPEDEGLQGRYKNALEGFFIDLGIGGALTTRSALKIIKAKRLAKQLAETPKGSAEYNQLLTKVVKQGEELAEIPEIKKKLSDDQIEARMDRAAFDKGLAHLPPAERDRLWKLQRTKRGLVVEKRGVKNITGDLDSVRQQIEELGPEPPKPTPFYETIDGKRRMTDEAKIWNKWNRTNKPLQNRLDELELKASETKVDEPREAAAIEVEADRDLLEEGVSWTGEEWVDADGNPAGPERFAEIQAAQESWTLKVQELAGALERGDIPYFRRKTSMRKKGVDMYGENIYEYKQKVVRDDEIADAFIEGKSFSEIIDNLEGNNPRNAGLGEGKVSLSHHRGAEQIKEQLRSHIGKQDLDLDDVRTIERFIDMMGDSMFEDVSFSFFKKIKPEGRFSFGKNLLEINSKIMSEGTFTRTMVHELWHTLSRYLPEADLKAYKKEFAKEQSRYIKNAKRELKERGEEVAAAKKFVDNNKPKLNMIQTKIDELLVKSSKGQLAPGESKILDSLTDAIKIINSYDMLELEFKVKDKTLTDFLRSIDPDDSFRGGFTDQNYRFSEVDEYFAEMMTDQLLLKHWKKADLAPSGTFTRMIQELGLVFKDLWISLKAQLGGPRTEKIFNDFLKGRNIEKAREYSLGATSERIAIIQGAYSTLAERILDEASIGKKLDPSDPGVQMLYRNMEDTLEKYKPDFKKGSPDDIPADVLRTYKDVAEGRKPLLEAAGLWDIEQDITTLRSPLMPGGRGNRYYSDASEQGSDFEIILNAISKRLDRIMATGMPPLSGRKIAQELESVFRKDGINLEDILYDESLVGATEIFNNNVENATNLIKLKFGLNFASEEAARWATKSVNAVNNPAIDQTEALIEMHRYLNAALQFSRVYQIWTRSAGQLLQTAQTQINAQGITETLKRQSLSFDKASAIAEASKVPADVVYTNLPPEYLQALETGQWTPRSEAFRHQIETLVMDTDTEHGLKTIQDLLGSPDAKEGVKKSRKIDDYEKRTKGLAVYYVNNLLSAAKTWAVQTSGLGRTLVEPLFYGATRGDMGLAVQQYEYLIRTFYGSLKLGQKAWMTGQSLYDPKIRTGAWVGDVAGQVDMNNTYARNRAYQLDDPHPSYDLNKTPFINELKNNPAHHAANVLWKLGTWNIRGQLAMDTFTKSLAGNSLAHVVGLEEGLSQGAAKGLKGKDLKSYAEQWADAKVEFYTFDAVINGETIADAIMKDEAAIQIGRILTFTDEVRAKMPNRSKRYGMELAKARGMTEAADIEAFARKYRDGELEGAQRLWNRFMRGADGIVQQADDLQNLPGVGQMTPTLTSAWSQVPQIWGKAQSARHGYIASFIQPFNRSPGDITKQWVRMIPGLNMTVDTFYRDLFNENAYLRNRWKGEVATGTVAGGLFATTVLNNEEFPIEFTGYGPNSPAMRKEWTDGERPALSWRTRGRDKNGNPVYGRWHSYRGFEPAATFIAGLADYKMLYADMSVQQREEMIGTFSVSTSANVMLGRFNSTYYKGIIEFIDAVGLMRNNLPGRRELEASERSKMARYVQRLLTGFIPESGRMREVSRAMDRYKRTVDSSVNPIESFDQAGEGLVKTKDALGRTVYLEEADANFQDGNPLMNWIAGYWRQQIDEIKNTIPGFSESLPERINWVTGLPIRNAGFLGSDQLPYDDAPWLSRLTGAYFGTILGTPSEFGIGSKGHDFDPRTPNQKKKGIITTNYKAALVNDELIKLSRAGATFEPPRPSDFAHGIRLSAPAFRKYKEYIYTTEIHGKTLMETLYDRMRSPDYKKYQYIIHPLRPSDGSTGFAKNEFIEEIMNNFKHAAKEKFRKDTSNEYRMEVIIVERQLEAAEELRERQKRGVPLDPIYNQGDSMDLNAQDFAASINR
jgi:hypothetical protein